MDNFRIDMTAEDPDVLAAIIKLVFQVSRCEGKAYNGATLGVSHYAIRPMTEGTPNAFGGWVHSFEPRPLRLVFFNHYSSPDAKEGKVAFPFKMDAAGAADFSRRWLEAVEYPTEPDIDGSCKKAWRVYNEDWGHIDSDHSAVVAITPVWAMYGK